MLLLVMPMIAMADDAKCDNVGDDDANDSNGRLQQLAFLLGLLPAVKLGPAHEVGLDEAIELPENLAVLIAERDIVDRGQGAILQSETMVVVLVVGSSGGSSTSSR